MRMTFSRVNYILLNVCCNYKKSFFMSAHIHTFSLSYGKKMSSIVFTDNPAVRWIIAERRTKLPEIRFICTGIRDT